MATQTKRWTLEELHSLPNDGNKYELIHGELFVTPPPTEEHETVLALLSQHLTPYVARHSLGVVYHPRAVVRNRGSEAEPDLMVREARRRVHSDWDDAPAPILVIEVLSPSTRRRDAQQKREFYREVGVQEYWIADPEHRNVRVIRAGFEDAIVSDTLIWHPSGASEPLRVPLGDIYSQA